MFPPTYLFRFLKKSQEISAFDSFLILLLFDVNCWLKVLSDSALSYSTIGFANYCTGSLPN